MRSSLLVVAALAALSSPAFAQDRTLPAGAYLAAQPPIDTIGAARIVPAAPALEGRSVGEDSAPVRHKRAHHRS